MKTVGFAVVVGFAVSASAPALARCHTPLIRTLNNQTVTGYMYADSGRPCRIRMKGSAGPTYSAHIVQRASNGSVHVAGSTIVYQSRRGFSGNDEFTYARRGLDRLNNPVVRTARVVVTVK